MDSSVFFCKVFMQSHDDASCLDFIGRDTRFFRNERLLYSYSFSLCSSFVDVRKIARSQSNKLLHKLESSKWLVMQLHGIYVMKILDHFSSIHLSICLLSFYSPSTSVPMWTGTPKLTRWIFVPLKRGITMKCWMWFILWMEPPSKLNHHKRELKWRLSRRIALIVFSFVN